MPRTYTTIIFDLGNVLLFHDNDRIHRGLADLAGCSVAEARRRLHDGGLWRAFDEGRLTPAAFHAELCRRLGIAWEFEGFVRLWNGIFTPNEPALALVERLRGRYRLVILSNTNPVHLAHIRAAHGRILAPFDHVVASCEAGCGKPDPAAFRLALELAGAEPRETVFIDDLEPYVHAAEGLGLTGVPFTGAPQLERALAALGVLTGPAT